MYLSFDGIDGAITEITVNLIFLSRGDKRIDQQFMIAFIPIVEKLRCFLRIPFGEVSPGSKMAFLNMIENLEAVEKTNETSSLTFQYFRSFIGRGESPRGVVQCTMYVIRKGQFLVVYRRNLGARTAAAFGESTHCGQRH